MSIKTVFLDAGGVLVFPNWSRISATLARHGVHVTAVALAAAEPYAKKHIEALAGRLGLTECVGCVLDSFVEKVEKPDPRFFEIALDRSGAARESTIHVGDLYEVDVVGARVAGAR